MEKVKSELHGVEQQSGWWCKRGCHAGEEVWGEGAVCAVLNLLS